jgi:myo-inositol catabolism protein IolS
MTNKSLGLGGWTYGPRQWTGEEDSHLLGAMEMALECGITHFDTATNYGDGYSERLIGRFLTAVPGRRDCIFLASKANPDEISAKSMLKAIDNSRSRMRVDTIDLYYIHWPQFNKDLRPWIEGLETARKQGKIRFVGVSNFSITQMEQVSKAGRIDAHQLAYNLLWRFNERDLIPFCANHNIKVITYASLAHGILAGQYDRHLNIPEGDQRSNILLFRPDVWPIIFKTVSEMKAVADRMHRSLTHLALGWLLSRRDITTVLVGARNPEQVEFNAKSTKEDVPVEVLDELNAISKRAMQQIPQEGNLYNYYP